MNTSERIAILQRIRTVAESALAEGVAAVFVTVSRQTPPSRSHVYLCGSCGPLGLVSQSSPDGDHWRVTARFQAARLIAFCSQQIERILKTA